MMSGFADFVHALALAAENLLAFLPDWTVGVFVLAFAAFITALVHWGVVIIACRVFAHTGDLIASLIFRTRGATRAGVLALVLSLVAPALPLSDNVDRLILDALAVLFVVSLGWLVVSVVNSTADFYLGQLRERVAEDAMIRRHLTQVRVLHRTLDILIIVLTAAGALMIFEPVRQFGLSLFASAGAAGLVVGLAARPVLSNLVAGIQLALTHPIGIGDGVVLENEWGLVEEITSSYVVVRLTNGRQLIAPLNYFIEKPFQNLSLPPAGVVVSFDLFARRGVSVDELRRTLTDSVSSSALWDRRLATLQVAAIKENGIDVRVCVSAANTSNAWELCCQARERLYSFLSAPAAAQPSG